MVMFAGFSWALLNNQNEMAIQHRFHKHSDVIYSAVELLQKWQPLQNASDQDKLEKCMCRERVVKWQHEFEPQTPTMTHIVEL